MQHPFQGVHRRRPLKGGPAGQALVEDRSQGINVGSRTDALLVAGRLLRGHVGRGAQDRAGRCQLAILFQTPGHTKVGDLGSACLGQQHVGRLEVAVDDAVLVGVVNSGSDLLHQARGLDGRQGPGLPGIASLRSRPPPETHSMLK